MVEMCVLKNRLDVLCVSKTCDVSSLGTEGSPKKLWA